MSGVSAEFATCLEHAVTSVPCAATSLTHMEFAVPSLIATASDICSVANPRAEKVKDLLAAFEQDWDEKHRVLQHSTQPTWRVPKATLRDAEQLAGRCFCSQHGKVLMGFGAKLKAMLRRFFGKGKSGRPHMDAGTVALMFIGDPPDGQAGGTPATTLYRLL